MAGATGSSRAGPRAKASLSAPAAASGPATWSARVRRRPPALPGEAERGVGASHPVTDVEAWQFRGVGAVSLVVRVGHALLFGQPPGQDPHELRHGCSSYLRPRIRQVVLDGRVRQAEAVGGPGVATGRGNREPAWIGPARRHALKGGGSCFAFLVGRLGHARARLDPKTDRGQAAEATLFDGLARVICGGCGPQVVDEAVLGAADPGVDHRAGGLHGQLVNRVDDDPDPRSRVGSFDAGDDD